MMRSIPATWKKRLLQPLMLGMLFSTLTAQAAGVVTVYKNPQCGCCVKWVEHLHRSGFAVAVNDVQDVSEYRARNGIPQQFGSCHTATLDGYALEGHVPVREIRRLLSERPNAIGLAVPAMPPGSPGMEGPHSMPYQVLLVQNDGRASVYQNYVVK